MIFQIFILLSAGTLECRKEKELEINHTPMTSNSSLSYPAMNQSKPCLLPNREQVNEEPTK